MHLKTHVEQQFILSLIALCRLILWKKTKQQQTIKQKQDKSFLSIKIKAFVLSQLKIWNSNTQILRIDSKQFVHYKFRLLPDEYKSIFHLLGDIKNFSCVNCCLNVSQLFSAADLSLRLLTGEIIDFTRRKMWLHMCRWSKSFSYCFIWQFTGNAGYWSVQLEIFFFKAKKSVKKKSYTEDTYIKSHNL